MLCLVRNFIAVCGILLPLSFVEAQLIPVVVDPNPSLSPKMRGMIPCGNDVNGDGVVRDLDINGNGTIDPVEQVEECRFRDFVPLVSALLTFLLFYLAVPIAALMFLYAGFLMLTNRGNEAQVTKAKSILTTVFWGLVVALAAWLIVTFILDFFVGGTPGSGFRMFV